MISMYTSDFFAHCRRELRACVVLSVSLTLIALVPAVTVGVILDRVIHSRADATLFAILIAFLFCHACEVAFRYIYDRLMLFVTHSSVVAAEAAFLGRLAQAEYLKLENFAADDGKARLMSIGPNVRFAADWAIGIRSIPLCLLIAAAGLMLVSVTLALPILILTASYVALHAIMSSLQKRTASSLQLAKGRELSCLDEMLQGLTSLKAHGGFAFMLHRWRQYKAAYGETLVRSSRLALVQGVFGLFYERASLAIILGLGAFEALNGRLSVGQLVMVNLLFRQVASQVRQIAPLLQRRGDFTASRIAAAKFWESRVGSASIQAKLLRSPDLAVHARDLGYRTPRGIPLLDGITIELPRGKTLAVVGDSGSGKSTLLKVLSGHYPASGGVLRILGSTLHTRDDFVYLSQNEALFSGALLDNVLLGGESRDELYEPLLEDLELVILGNEPDRRTTRGTASALSGGERQRIMLARALARRPAALFLDEPTTGLDPRRRRIAVQLIERVAQEGALVVFASHDEELIQRADYVLQLHQGTSVAFGPRESILNIPGQHVASTTHE